jgi:dihydropteroate synthase
MKIGQKTFTWGYKTYIMGIINITPDSFSGDGLLLEKDFVRRAVEQAKAFAADGAHLLDVGGESTRPGAAAVDSETEKSRVVPVIKALVQETDLPVSVDTYKAAVAEAALAAGASLINDIWALRKEPLIAKVAAEHGAPIILMHNRSRKQDVARKEELGGYYSHSDMKDVLAEIKFELAEAVAAARQAGVEEEKIILDPGVGFGKTVSQNLELVNHLDQIKKMGYPLLVGLSRKSFIGHTLNLPPDQRLEGTAAANVIAILRGADILRVHDVRFMSRLALMADAIVRGVA